MLPFMFLEVVVNTNLQNCNTLNICLWVSWLQICKMYNGAELSQRVYNFYYSFIHAFKYPSGIRLRMQIILTSNSCQKSENSCVLMHTSPSTFRRWTIIIMCPKRDPSHGMNQILKLWSNALHNHLYTSLIINHFTEFWYLNLWTIRLLWK